MDFVDLTHSIKIKFDCFPNKNNTVEMKLGIMEQVYMMLLTPLGHEYLTKYDNFRNMLKVKVNEFMMEPRVESFGQFMAVSRDVLNVIRNINISKE